MGACHVHPTGAELGCVDCLQDQRDCLREEVDRLRATLEIASLEPQGERCVRCGWESEDGVVFRVRRQCWPCKRIEELEKLIVRVGQVFDSPDIRGPHLIVPHELAADVLTIQLKHE